MQSLRCWKGGVEVMEEKKKKDKNKLLDWVEKSRKHEKDEKKSILHSTVHILLVYYR